jgi:hypothetical protein
MGDDYGLLQKGGAGKPKEFRYFSLSAQRKILSPKL